MNLKTRLLFVALCALSGSLLFLACANFDIWPLAWFGMLPWLWVVLDERCGSPFFYGWVAGLLANGGGFYWLNGLLERFGHMPFWASAPIYLLLIAYQGLEWAAFAWALRRLRDHTTLPVALLAPIVMTALELVTPFIFPWYLAITQAWVRPVIQIADLTGPLGVTFLVVLVNGALYDTLAPLLRRRRPSLRPLAVTAGVMAAVLLYGQVRIRQVEARRDAAETIRIGVVQANIGIQEKFVPQLGAEQLALHQRLSADLAARGADLIVWPESSYPYAINRAQHADFPDGDPRQAMRGFKVPLLFGALTRGRDSEYPFNTALMLDATGRIRATFDKNFLLVFGEYIPFYERMKWIRTLIPEASNFARGDGVTTFPLEVQRPGGQSSIRIGPMICYEDIIPSFGRRLVARRPNVLVNITNDAWFGATSEPWEHMALAVYRAVEHRLDLVRAVNTGVSAFIDSTGRVYRHGPAVDPIVTPDVPPLTLLEPVAVQEASGLYGRIGDLFGLLNLAALLALAAWAGHRAGRPVAWRALLAGIGLLSALGALAAFLSAPGSPGLAFALLAHRPMPASDETFAVGLRLVGAVGVAGIASGFVLRWRLRDAARRAEVALAATTAAVVPAFLFGRIEGETTSLVFAALGAIALMLLGRRLADRRRRATPPRGDEADPKRPARDGPPPHKQSRRAASSRGASRRRPT